MSMFNDDFDPLSDLETLKLTYTNLHNNMLELARGFNDRGELIDRLISHVKDLTIAHNHLDSSMMVLQDRIIQLENKNDKTKDNTTQG